MSSTGQAFFNGKTAIITGSSSGIGKATAIRFSELGCQVIVSGRNIEKLNDTATQCAEKSGSIKNVVSIIGDITEEPVRQKLVSEALNHFGKIDILVNNAGYGGITMTLDGSGTMELLQQNLDRNLISAVDLAQKCAPHLLKTKGNIVNVSSVRATRPDFRATYYCMSKAALDMYTKCLAQELGPHGVRVNSVNPGWVKTNIIRTSRGNDVSDEEVNAVFENGKHLSVLGMCGEAIDIAHAIIFLASDQSKFITGECLYLDGGLQLGKLSPL